MNQQATTPNQGQMAEIHDGSKTVAVGDFVVGRGQQAGSVDVRMSLTVIERFSEGLYSPNKAFEELVSNSYDANAHAYG